MISVVKVLKSFQKNALKYYKWIGKATSIRAGKCYVMIAPFMRTRFPFAVAISLFLAVCFYRTTYLEFERIRETLFADQEGPRVELSVPMDDSRPLLFVELRNFSRTEVQIDVRSGRAVDDKILIPSEGSRTVYLKPQATIQFHSESGEWQLQRAEHRNYYGARKGVFNYIIVPSPSRNYLSPSWFAALFCFFLLIPLSLLLPAATKRTVSLLALFVLFWCGLLLSPFLSQYKVLVATKTFFLLAGLFYIPSFVSGYRLLRIRVERISPAKGLFLLHASLTVIAVFLFFLFQMLHSLREFEGNYSGFLVLSQKFVRSNPLVQDRPDLTNELMIAKGRGGYDAQFFYIMAFDPLLRVYAEKPRMYRRVVDTAPYRYGRIGFSFLTKIFSLNIPRLYPNTMIALILLSHAVGVFFLTRIAGIFGVSPFWALLYMLVPGFTVALRLGMPESIAAAFLIAGFFYHLRSRFLPASIFFAASILVRETTALFVLILALREFLYGKRIGWILLFASTIPYCLWRLYIGWVLFPTFGREAFLYNPGGTTTPFAGVIALFRALNRGEYIPEMALSAQSFAILLIALFVLSAILLWRIRNYLALVLFAYCLLALSLDYHMVFTPILNAERVTYEAFVLTLILFLASRQKMMERAMIVLFFLFVLLFDWSRMTYSSIFQAGFLMDVIRS